MKPQNFEEKIVWYSIVGTYGFYFTGLLYPVVPAIAWILVFYLFKKLWQQGNNTTDPKITIPWIAWVWVVSMLVMQFALVMGHLDFDLGIAATIKSSFGWAKGWALFALFPLISCLNIRPQLLYRAICILCLQSLIIFPFFYAGFLLRLPPVLYTLPFDFFGGPDGIFQVALYDVDIDGNDQARIGLFAPWSAGIGYVGNAYFPLCLREANPRWKWIGIAGSILMVWISRSRLAAISLPAAWLLAKLIANFQRPYLWFSASFLSLIGGVFAESIVDTTQNVREQIRRVRPSSDRVRKSIDNIGLHRFPEAPITGHGVVERGPKLVEFMPIGSHNTWIGLLFVKGLVGLCAFIIPMICTFIVLVVKAQKSQIAQSCLSIFFIIFFNTFGDSIEVTAYIIWPGLMFLGMGLQETQKQNQVLSTV